MMKYLAIFWGVGGILGLLAAAIFRLLPKAVSAMQAELTWYHWVLLIGNVVGMAYFEGYKGFQKAFSPRVAARSRYLYKHGSTIQLLSGPLFCMAFYAAPRRRVIGAFALTIGVVALVLIFQTLPQPLRGILDAGVVVGLTWGGVATAAWAVRAFTDDEFSHDPELT